ncbi:NAD-dependent succinate-semialdehyde dehydrogenase [Pseudomonas sp. ZM23]|uniref:NAD-dependent succinate-semialdehyde dehydrogenase n=1 Tax=Pseudomonas triclosanedens TaxID=2961893 RepID=A0ABY7A4M9_9PSED|nr:NAD-dependent succinate-semialdehyde dehydrogenase [Pseudomonas triclosanedens]MCP8464429.1 NAD-dependent succinate-semialdehyde dehydrogenase [Pseudomonas triclosanedens]MCP8471563.1 NAD-dependent succinate-semialdehyde dehydrogenase [Pseudomonas triclosanedens]MCP8477625.1 NAD-dependent succinate-semialdehyde dehydrogenase [Pseudomonas triclosanedens]WAI51084.1 NAD-dependent succinate-semialdehyde dehydrogenase [Pseudomonas triclosanedens]
MKLNDCKLFRQQAYVDGRWCDADDGRSLDVHDPATGERLGSVPLMGGAEAVRAIEAANAALEGWRAKTAKERAQILRRWFELLLEHEEDLARLMTFEQGKPLHEALGEIRYAASFIEWFAEEGKRIYGDVIPSPAADKRLLVIKQGIGVCAAITPWNFPAAMITRKAAPALAAGCTMVIKPANETPFSALALVELAERAGVPAGVLNVVTGDAPAIGAQLTGHPLVRKLSFTGSTPVGRLLMAQCADTIKKVSLELGGNAPFIVFEDADIEAAVEGALIAKYRNAGQTCVCVNRFYVHDAVYERFTARFVERVRELAVGHGAEPNTQIGPLITDKAVSKVQSLVDDATAKGAELVLGGKPHALGGNFFEPTVLGGIRPGMDLLQDEIFGPVAALVRFSSDAEVIELANDTLYGLAAYFYSRDLARVFRVAERLEYGMVGINTGLISNEVAPFGGVKQSGLGREGSRYGIEDYLEIKYLCLAV